MVQGLRKIKNQHVERLKVNNVLRETKKEIFGTSEGNAELERNILLLAHSLEKGMSIPSPRPKFGLQKAKTLLLLLEQSAGDRRICGRYAYIESASVLDTYLNFTDNDVADLKRRFDRIKLILKKENPAGAIHIDSMNSLYEKLDFPAIDYFLRSRHSIRSFVNRAVEEETVDNAIALALRAPSACNRQPEKVHWTSDPSKVRVMNELVPGNKGFEDQVPNWAIVTEDRSLFGANETFQWYVNGGIFLAYLVNAFHAYKIGSCIFQLPVAYEKMDEIRQLAHIPANETIIAAVGFGYAAEKNKFVTADRRPVDELTQRF